MSAQPSQHRLAIRERQFLEILDLALVVVRALGLRLVAALAMGIIPCFLVNVWLTHDLASVEMVENNSAAVFWYASLQLLLIVLEAPLATSLGTAYIGKAMFQERPPFGEVFREWFVALPQLILLQGAGRAAIAIFALMAVANGAYWYIWAGLLPMPIVYWFWPYLNEIILLEKNKLFTGRATGISTFRRARLLHLPNVGDLIGRWLWSLVVGFALFFGLAEGLSIAVSYLTGYVHGETATLLWYYPTAAWLVVGYFTVVRYLSYLDLRIRREGWELDLVMRAEAARQTRQIA